MENIPKVQQRVFKTFVYVKMAMLPMALQQRAQHVLAMVRTFVRLVTVDITKLAKRVRHAHQGNTKRPTISRHHAKMIAMLALTLTPIKLPVLLAI